MPADLEEIVGSVSDDDRNREELLAENKDLRGRLAVLEKGANKTKQLEMTRLRLSKLESLGMLAGGIAHDFNNILTGIMGNLSLALYKDVESTQASNYLRVAEEACQRATGLTEQLLTFAKGGKPIREDTDLGVLIEETCRFALQGSNCRCEVDLQPDLYHAYVDRAQITQVIQNLALNAIQAMPEGGVVTLIARNRQVAETTLAGLAPGRYVSISLTDEGVGMQADVREHIFDPCFSTKSEGRGLGLAVVHSIVSRHGGHVELRSEPGQGATFQVLLEAGLEVGRRVESPELPTTSGSGSVSGRPG
jgi:signal transduction histidine kinase